MATSDGGKSDKSFARKYLGPTYRVEIMPVSEAVDRHLKYLKPLRCRASNKGEDRDDNQ